MRPGTKRTAHVEMLVFIAYAQNPPLNAHVDQAGLEF